MTSSRLPTDTAMRRAIRRVWDGATAADLAAGLRWYEDAADTARALAAGTDGRVTFEQAAGVIAALSPRQTWARNVIAAAAMIDGDPAPRGVFGRQAATARAILAGTLAGPTGPKVSAFHRAIMGDAAAVVVDVWAARAAGVAMPEGAGLTAAQYRRIAAAYTAVADRLGVDARDLQAAVWVAIRGGAE